MNTDENRYTQISTIQGVKIFFQKEVLCRVINLTIHTKITNYNR